jgi:hypothetical protein
MNGKGGDLKSRFHTARIIHGALMASVPVYALIVALMSGNAEFMAGLQNDPPHYAIFKYALYGIGLSVFFVILYLRRSILTGRGGMDHLNRTHSDRFLYLALVTASLCGMVAVLGLMAFFLYKVAADSYLLMVLSLLYFSYFFPRFPQWETWAREYPLAPPLAPDGER